MVLYRTFLYEDTFHFIQDVLELPKPTFPFTFQVVVFDDDLRDRLHSRHHGFGVGEVALVEEVENFFDEMEGRPVLLDVLGECLFIIEVEDEVLPFFLLSEIFFPGILSNLVY